jgi:hypothetical protein
LFRRNPARRGKNRPAIHRRLRKNIMIFKSRRGLLIHKFPAMKKVLQNYLEQQNRATIAIW